MIRKFRKGEFGIEGHGGGNCGITHLFHFATNCPNRNEEHSLIKILEDYLDAEYDYNGQYLVEITLNDSQFQRYEPTVLDAGFKMVTEFKNGNSDNTVRVYHLIYTLDTKRGAYGEYNDDYDDYDEEEY